MSSETMEISTEQLDDIRQDLLDSTDNLPKNSKVLMILEDDAVRLNALIKQHDKCNNEEWTREQLEDIRQDLLDSADNLPKNATVTKILSDDAVRLNAMIERNEQNKEEI